MPHGGIVQDSTGDRDPEQEVSDTDPFRIAAVCFIPFKRTTFPYLLFNGAGLSAGRGSVTYVKLDGIAW